MKKYFVCVLMIGLGASLTAFAEPKPTDSWDTIRSAQNVGVNQTAMSEAFGINGFFDACIDGQYIRSIKPHTVCLQEGADIPYGDGSSAAGPCLKWGPQYVRLPITHTELKCVKSGPDNWYGEGNVPGPCLKWGNVTVTLPTNPRFEVHTQEYVPYGEAGGAVLGRHLFYKNYQIPACSN